MNMVLIIIVLLSIAGLLGYCLWDKQRTRRMLNVDIFKPLQDWQYENFIKLAREAGYEKLFLVWMRKVRQKYGHDGVKLGHIYWVFSKCCHNEKVTEAVQVPKFDDPENCEVKFKFEPQNKQ